MIDKYHNIYNDLTYFIFNEMTREDLIQNGYNNQEIALFIECYNRCKNLTHKYEEDEIDEKTWDYKQQKCLIAYTEEILHFV